jgi:hypothetical protein
VLDRADLDADLASLPEPIRNLPIQGASNVLRTRYLARHGGVWTDATVLPIRPLDDWLPELMEPAGFFAFAKPGPARPMSSWFLASEAGAYIPRRLLSEIVAYWDRPRQRGTFLPGSFRERLAFRLRSPGRYEWCRRYMDDHIWAVRPDGGRDSGLFPYHWYHYLTGWLIESDEEFRQTWARMPCRAALAVHTVQRARTQDGLDEREFRQAVPHLLGSGPVQKLNWRMDWPPETFVPPKAGSARIVQFPARNRNGEGPKTGAKL